MKGIQQRGRQAVMADSLARVHRDFDAFLEEKVNLNWDDQRRKIFNHFGLGGKDIEAGESITTKGSFGRTSKGARAGDNSHQASGKRSVFGRSGLEKSVIGQRGASTNGNELFFNSVERGDASTSQSADSGFLREKMRLFAAKVQRLNAARLDELPFLLLHEFADVEERAGGDVSNSYPFFLPRLRFL